MAGQVGGKVLLPADETGRKGTPRLVDMSGTASELQGGGVPQWMMA